ncbi:MAG TPA: acyltransferase [Longimicrobium sp.]
MTVSAPAAVPAPPHPSAADERGWRQRLLARLSRRTSSGRFIPEIDGLRFVSIALVVLYHMAGYVAGRPGVSTGGPLFGVAIHGHYGVPIFFVISGFVLGLPFASQHLSAGRQVRLRPYFLRRLTRLEPPYVLAMLALFPAVAVMTGTPPSQLLPHLLASLAYVHNLVYAQPSAINSVAWSLEIEVQFYVLAPLLAAAAFRWRSAPLRRWGLLAVSAAAIVAQLTLLEGTRFVTLASFIQFFLLGFLLADLYTTDWTRPPTRSGAWDALWLACWPAMWLAWEAPPAVTAFAFPAVVLAVFAASLRGRLSRAALSNPWVVTIGGMCYTIYLLHYPLISLLGRGVAALGAPANTTLSLLLHCALVIPPLLVVCAVYFALVERPCMDPAWPTHLRTWLAARFRSTRTMVEPATPA